MNGQRGKGFFRIITGSCGVIRKFVSFGTALIFALPPPAIAQQIVPDGKTATKLAIQGNVTDVTTSTINGANAYNSFSTFNVYQGNVVNLHVPVNAANLLNLVHGQVSSIDGILNAYQNGRIGGNVYFANPHGFLVGSSGVINVGALTVMTPTRAFMESFFLAPGVPSEAATAMLLNRTAPIASNGLISIRGKVNATGDIRFSAGNIQNYGVITAGAVIPENAIQFSDLVNADGLESGAEIAMHNGIIEILAAGDVINAGTIVTDGTNNQNGGEIHITAGNDVTLQDGSILSARGRGEQSNGGNIIVFADRNAVMNGTALIDVRGGDSSGDGGFIELSAREKVLLDGGLFKSYAEKGTAGRVLIDPNEIIIGNLQKTEDGQTTAFVNFSSGRDIELIADESIIINSNVILSTRRVARDLADTADNHLNAISLGNSGDISLTAPQITINSGAMLLAHAINKKDDATQQVTTHKAGDITLTATNVAETPLIQLGNETRTAAITITGATIKGGNIDITAQAGDSNPDNGPPTTFENFTVGELKTLLTENLPMS
jgi:filamentous hemagglutinin family protein